MKETIVKVARDTASPPDQQQFRRAAGQQLEQQPKKTNSSKSNVFHTGKAVLLFKRTLLQHFTLTLPLLAKNMFLGNSAHSRARVMDNQAPV